MQIPLRNRSGATVAYATIDEADAVRVSVHRWSLHQEGYARGWVNGKTLFMHRFILGLTDPSIETDHRNRNGLDNRRSNLRTSNRSGNMQNVGSHRGSSSSFRGVSLHRRTGKWQANARLNGHLHYLGLYATEEEAARVAADWRALHMPYSTEPNHKGVK